MDPEEAKKFDLELTKQFHELFDMGLLEQLSTSVPTSHIAKIFLNLFENMENLKKLFKKYFPFHDQKNVSSLGEIVRWNIRKTLSEKDYLLTYTIIPKHIIQILQYKRNL